MVMVSEETKWHRSHRFQLSCPKYKLSTYYVTHDLLSHGQLRIFLLNRLSRESLYIL